MAVYRRRPGRRCAESTGATTPEVVRARLYSWSTHQQHHRSLVSQCRGFCVQQRACLRAGASPNGLSRGEQALIHAHLEREHLRCLQNAVQTHRRSNQDSLIWSAGRWAKQAQMPSVKGVFSPQVSFASLSPARTAPCITATHTICRYKAAHGQCEGSIATTWQAWTYYSLCMAKRLHCQQLSTQNTLVQSNIVLHRLRG